MISQFVSPYEQRLLGDLDFDFPEGTHAIGRLDEESEGLLILSTDKTLTRRLLHPRKKHKRSYLVLVNRVMSEETVTQLRNGIEILVQGKGSYRTQPCDVTLIDKPMHLPEHPNGFNDNFPHTWLRFELEEGKKRQIRKMCKAVRHSCLRLIRTSINDLGLGSMQPGEVKEMEREALFKLLRLE
jgi:23S rRNA pseudouridine2457 synthase